MGKFKIFRRAHFPSLREVLQQYACMFKVCPYYPLERFYFLSVVVVLSKRGFDAFSPASNEETPMSKGKTVLFIRAFTPNTQAERKL